ncbi:Rieske 2Fe-2S domain-containing protein [Haloarcula sp. JP-L23]|uniref:Rieske (2Fe-2S) protein n=1 Tax=Haloarcula sp. JP-L23 TaxID=2716717 RepID=UPI00140F13FA|nr:Rieske 2Fe-2S domain-containing protein [Haloarcula sp. JP-L23]
MHQLTTVETVHDTGSYLFTATGPYGDLEEVVVVPCEDGVEAWVNRCTHENQHFDTGRGVPMRDGQLLCPRHGSLFDACEGDCDNGEAAGTTLPGVDVAERHGTVFLVDDDYEFSHEGGTDDDEGPSSSSHLQL